VVAFEPDVLVCDIAMPEEDGYSLIRRLRSRGGKHATTPALALTAYARTEDQERALSAGFQLHLAKPVNSHALISAIASIALPSARATP
jgi:CheY-like chemotaxis protein